MGHSYLTHSVLSVEEERLVCIPCGELLTLKHIRLLHRVDLAEIRQRYFH